MHGRPLWTATLLWLALTADASAQQEPVDWRAANAAVAQFPRGHADVLKWEQAHDTPSKEAPAAAPGLWLATAEAAVRQAWRARPALASSLSRLGPLAQEQLAQGHWLEVDPTVRRRLDDLDAILDTAADARKAWWHAVAAQAELKLQQDRQDTAEAAAELARRMARVGNWSRMEQARFQSRLGGVKLETLNAAVRARQAQSALLQTMQLWGTATSVGVPDALPAEPEPSLTEASVQKNLAALRAVLPRTQSLQVQANAEQAFGIYQAKVSAAQLLQEEQTLQQFISDETLLRYNGMLLSVWDLLEQTNAQLQAGVNLIHARHALLVAHANLQWVLQGGTATAEE